VQSGLKQSDDLPAFAESFFRAGNGYFSKEATRLILSILQITLCRSKVPRVQLGTLSDEEDFEGQIS
jgi:hypothetical protein